MYCPKCGTQINERAAFCPQCGTPISAPSQPQKSEAQNQNYQNNENTVSISAKKKHRHNKIFISIVCGILALTVLLIFIFTRKSPVETIPFSFFGYELEIPDTFTYNSAQSYEIYAMFNNNENPDSRIDIIYEDNDYSADNVDPYDLIGQVYDMYGQTIRPGVTQAKVVDSIAGMYTIKGKILMPSSPSMWTVYACINDKSELFYFILTDTSGDMEDIFEESIYKTVVRYQ